MGKKGGRNKMKRLAAPRSWDISRKSNRFVFKPLPGPHPIAAAYPLGVVIRDLASMANLSRELKFILKTGKVKVDGTERRTSRFPVGLFNVVSVPLEGVDYTPTTLMALLQSLIAKTAAAGAADSQITLQADERTRSIIATGRGGAMFDQVAKIIETLDKALSPAGIRLGVQEMTRVGMKEPEMEHAAELFKRCLMEKKFIGDDVKEFRSKYQDVGYSFDAEK